MDTENIWSVLLEMKGEGRLFLSKLCLAGEGMMKRRKKASLNTGCRIEKKSLAGNFPFNYTKHFYYI